MKLTGKRNIQKVTGWLVIIIGIGFLAIPIAETPPLSHSTIAQALIAVLVPVVLLAGIVFGGKKMIRWILILPAVYFAVSMVVWYFIENPDSAFFSLLILVTVILTVFLLLSWILLISGWNLIHQADQE